MRKLYIVVCLIGMAFLLSFGALAETSDTAQAVLTLTAVLNIGVDDSGLSGITVIQANLASWVGTPGDMYRSFGSFVVEILALTNFQVAISQAAASSDPAYLAAHPLGNKEQVLRLLEDDGSTVIGWIPDNGTGTYDISSYFAGANNTPGEDETFYLEVYLDNLGDRKAGEVITFTVTVAVSDPTI